MGMAAKAIGRAGGVEKIWSAGGKNEIENKNNNQRKSGREMAQGGRMNNGEMVEAGMKRKAAIAGENESVKRKRNGGGMKM